MFIFPGVGLGCILAEVQVVTDSMFLAASHALAASVSKERLATGALYPDQSRLREVSASISAEVIRQARREELGRPIAEADVERTVAEAMWWPEYQRYV